MAILGASLTSMGILFNHAETYLRFVRGLELSSSDIATIAWRITATNSWCYAFLCCFVLSGASLVGMPIYATFCGLKAISKSSESYSNTKMIVHTPTSTTLHSAKIATYRQGLPVSIPDDFNQLFKPMFTNKYHNPVNNNDLRNDISGAKQLSDELSARMWTQTELAKIALLIYESDIVVPEFKKGGFRGWITTFFSKLGRNDAPKKADKKPYQKISKSLQCSFSNLVLFYKASQNTSLDLE